VTTMLSAVTTIGLLPDDADRCRAFRAARPTQRGAARDGDGHHGNASSCGLRVRPYYQYLLAEILGWLLWSATFVSLGDGVGDYLYAFIGRPDGNAIALIVLDGTLGLGWPPSDIGGSDKLDASAAKHMMSSCGHG
jgi:hypothetical protein